MHREKGQGGPGRESTSEGVEEGCSRAAMAERSRDGRALTAQRRSWALLRQAVGTRGGFLSWEVEAVFFFFFKPVQAGWEPGWLDSKEGSLSTPSLLYSLPTLHCASIPGRDHGMLVY